MPNETLYDALDKWRNRELNIARLFSGDTIDSRYYQQEKLKHYQRLRNQFGLEPRDRRDISFDLLKREITKLEQHLYPQPALRLFHRALSTLQRFFGPERLIHHIQQERESARVKDVVQTALEKYPIEHSPAAKMMDQPQQIDSLTQNNSSMNENNFARLSQQLKETGFGEGLNAQLKEKMMQGEEKFMLTFQSNFGKDATVSTLHFKKDGADYQFQRFNLMTQKNGFDEPLKQTFFINAGQDNFTLKEGYNLLNGRGVLKELENRQGEKYTAWKQLDFKAPDQYGNFKMHTYGEKYGFNFEASLNRHPIKELNDPAVKKELMKSLQEGNRETVTLVRNGQDTKIMLEAAPRFKSLNFYEMTGLKVRADKLYQDASQGQAAEQKVSKQQKAGAEGDDAPSAPKKRTRKRQSI